MAIFVYEMSLDESLAKFGEQLNPVRFAITVDANSPIYLGNGDSLRIAREDTDLPALLIYAHDQDREPVIATRMPE